MLLEVKNISKEFPGVKALDNVSLTLQKGEILALIGENGAGKSTLIKILSGAYTADSGEVWLKNIKQGHLSPTEAISKGIAVIYQELNSVNQLTVAENIFMGNLPKHPRYKTIDYAVLKKRSIELLNKVGLYVDPFSLMENLSIAQKQLVEIAKALSKNIEVLIMDEPTAALTNKEIDILFDIVNNLCDQGIGVLYVSHRMEEIFRISHRVAVMRDGQLVSIYNTTETQVSRLISDMVGREISDLYPKKNALIGDTCFAVEGLHTERLKNISFSIRKGEILGMFGLMGCGRTDIARAIFGASKRLSGTMTLDGSIIQPKMPWDAKRLGIAYLPSDRKQEGLMLIHPVSTNISITILEKIKKLGLLNKTLENSMVRDWIKRLDIRTPGPNTLIESLSGGNQQKAVLAKWLSIHPKLLILNEPTRGIDVGAKTEIYKLMNQLCEQGIGILMISSDLPEVMGMSDRVLIIHDGKVGGIVEKEQFSQDDILSKAIGISACK